MPSRGLAHDLDPGVLLQRVAQQRPEGLARRRTPVPGSAPPALEGSGAVRRASVRLRFRAMPPLITREEALAPRRARGPRRDRGAGRARLAGAPGALRRLDRPVLAGQREVGRLRRGLRLLRAVALRRGRDADARDDGARADPRARARGRGGGRAPLLHGHPGPGAVQARLREGARGRAAGRRAHEPQALRVDRPHERRRAPRRCARPGIQRVHHNVETAESYYPEVSTTVRYEGRLRTIDAVREAGLETCVGGILNLGESREQRVEMAFELADDRPDVGADQPAQPAPGHEVRRPRLHGPVGGGQVDRDLPADPARRAVPAVRRARREPRRAAAAGGQGRAQRRDDGQLPDDARLDARRGPRDVQELGLNVARQPDNGANPRPDNRSGWLDGETPDVVEDVPRHAATPRRPASRSGCGTRRRSCASRKRRGARRAPTARRTAGRAKRPERAASRHVTDDRTSASHELEELGLLPPHAAWSAGRRARASCSTASRCCCCARTTTSGSPTTRACARRRPTRRCAGASAPGASRLVSGTMTVHRRLEERLAAFKGTRGARCCSARATWPTSASISALAGRGRRSSSPTSSTTPRSSTAAGWRGAETSSTATATSSTSRGALRAGRRRAAR